MYCLNSALSANDRNNNTRDNKNGATKNIDVPELLNYGTVVEKYVKIGTFITETPGRRKYGAKSRRML